MAEQNRLHISGSGRSNGGDFSDVRISGSGKVNGDAVVSGEVHVSGSGSFDGSVSCSELHVSGSTKIGGSLEVSGDTRISGSLHVERDFRGSNIGISGSGSIRGSMEAQFLQVSGSVKTDGRIRSKYMKVSGKTESLDVEAETFHCSGKVNIDGLLNAQQIEIRSAGDSRIREIGCEDIIVTREPHSAFLGGLLSLINKDFAGGGTLSADIIEGTNVRLEYTAAADVRGANVYLGSGCKIGRVEYSGTIEIAEDAVVAEKIKVG